MSEPNLPDEDGLQPDEISPQAGAWSGLLFDNPTIGLPPQLTWTFTVNCKEVSRTFGSSYVSVTADWVPLPGAAWSAMAGRSASCEAFGDPIECSAYFFDHYCYEVAHVRIFEQVGSRLRVAIEARGDMDGLGVPEWRVEQWLDFEGVSVQLSGVTTAEEASRRLSDFTDRSGLVATDNRHNFRFVESGD
jgi:hypothetical protein